MGGEDGDQANAYAAGWLGGRGAMGEERLLVELPAHSALERALRRHLPGVAWAYLHSSPGPFWPNVEAILTDGRRDGRPPCDRSRFPRLRFVQRAYTGMDGFPFDRFPEDAVFAGNVGAYAPYVAEQAIALLMALAKRLETGYEMVRAGRLRPVEPTRSLLGKTVLILGFGEIAHEIAIRLHPFGATIHGLNRDGSPRPGADRMFGAEALASALPLADVIIDCRPLTRRTVGTIGATELSLLREDAMLVNVGRAATIDERALYEHLKTHGRTHAAFDAWWREDYEKGETGTAFPFFELANFFGSPHAAGITEGSRERSYEMAAANLGRFVRGEPPLGVVDPGEYTTA